MDCNLKMQLWDIRKQHHIKDNKRHLIQELAYLYVWKFICALKDSRRDLHSYVHITLILQQKTSSSQTIAFQNMASVPVLRVNHIIEQMTKRGMLKVQS